MRVNVYAEEMTDRVEVISKEIEGHTYTALRFYLALPATVDGKQYQGPFMHRPGDDDSAAVTFWGKQDLRAVLRKALGLLNAHYAPPAPAGTFALDMHRTTQLYRLIALNARPGMRELLRDLAKVGGLISPGPAAASVWPDGRLRAPGEELANLSFMFEQLCNESEALDRNDDWGELGVWVPA